MVDNLQKLKKDIASNNVVIFVGPDVSVYTTNDETQVSHWKGLIKHGFQQFDRLGQINDKPLTNLDDNKTDINEYVLISNLIKPYLKEQPSVYQTWLINTVGQLFPIKPELIQAIGELKCPIVTTNYDSLLEDTLHKETLTWHEYQNNTSLKDITNYILHLYGHYQNSDSVIISSDDYNQLHNDEFAQSKLRMLVKGKTLLFIGYETDIHDPNFSNVLKWLFNITMINPPIIYKLIRSNNYGSFLENIKEISYGNNFQDLLLFIKNLSSFSSLRHTSLSLAERRESIREKYLNYLIKEYGQVSIFGYANNDINLPLESVYVDLKFDPTHPSIKAMTTVHINEEFRRKLVSPGFFSETEKRKLFQVVTERNAFNPHTIYRDLMIDQWLNVLLSNNQIFSDHEARTIRYKISQLKQNILTENHLKESQQYQIQQAYKEFKHFIILGHPGSGKTTLSKWLVINTAQQCLRKRNMLYDRNDYFHEKIPILIPIWKYVDFVNTSQQKVTLLEFIYENPTFNSTFFTMEERKDLSTWIIECLLHGNILVIFEGLDEVPVHVDRTDLMKEINCLLERGTDYDSKSGKLIHSLYEQKEINNTKNPIIGNRFILTSRIEGNYFEDINFYIPRLTIQDMSNEALKLFCNSYMESIQKISRKENKIDQLYNDIIKNQDIFQLAINPQLASVIAAVYHQYEGKLPEKRIDLYEQAIDNMIEQLIISSTNEQIQFNSIMLWSILQEIAEYLHHKVEGLSEKILKEIIGKCLTSLNLMNTSDIIESLVDIFKYKVGLLNEFGHDSFRFIHRTFQEYLAAKSLIYFNGIERSKEMIYENIQKKIDIPNWRVPLDMTFGILSKYHQNNGLFHYILENLLTNQSILSLIPFVIIDSLNDMYFLSKDIEHDLIRKLAEMLLSDYKNLSGFARLIEHQNLIHFYFSKLKKISYHTTVKWFIEKMIDDNIAPCANIIYHLKWYNPKFHQILLINLHHDSQFCEWPIDSLLRFYSNQIQNNAILTELKFKNALVDNPELIQHINHDSHWLSLIVALYGGYHNYNSERTISEYYALSQFLQLDENIRMPFFFYYQDIWGKDRTANNMVAHMDTTQTNYWREKPLFDQKKIYKESFLTANILELLKEKKSPLVLTKKLRKQIKTQKLVIHEKIEALIALIALGDNDFIQLTLKEEDQTLITYIEHRIDQLISVLKDPIARWSTHINTYLLKIQNNSSIHCKIYLSFIADSGGLPVNTHILANAANTSEEKSTFNAEYFAYKLTSTTTDFTYDIAVIADKLDVFGNSNEIMNSVLKIHNTIQRYRPIRMYPWPLDIFIFKSRDQNDIPIEFFNCLENFHTNVPYLPAAISNMFFAEGYFNRNPELILPVILLHFGIMSTQSERFEIYANLLPELGTKVNIKEFLLEKIHSIHHSYYKARALYQLAEFYDEKCYELLKEAFQTTKNISKSVLKFQILEKIFNVLHYKEVTEKCFIQQVINELILICDTIDNVYDRATASIRLSFYGSGEFRKRYIANAIFTLSQMNRNEEKIEFIIKLKPLVSLYPDLQINFNEIINHMKNKTHHYLIHSYYGRILSAEQLQTDNIELQSLFRLFAQLNDNKISINKIETIDQLWLNVYQDITNQSHIEKLLKLALNTELLLTPLAAIVIDELLQQSKEEMISVLFPYIIKPSNEVLPIVHRWFTDYDHSHQIKNLAAILLVEGKRIFESVIDTIVELITNDNDQMRYRAQRIFQHPERDPKKPSKRISVIGERTLMKIFQHLTKNRHFPRTGAYLRSFFYDLLWDDPIVYMNLLKKVTKLKETNDSTDVQRMFYFNKIKFIDDRTWNLILNSLQSIPYATYIEEVFHSTIVLTQSNQITENDWNNFVRILSTNDRSQFVEKFYIIFTDVAVINLILNEICALTTINDEEDLEIIESKVINEISVQIEDLLQYTYHQIIHIARCNFYVSCELNQAILNILNNIQINNIMMENLMKWLTQKMIGFNDVHNTRFSLMFIDFLLCLLSACVQKEDYIYRKITNSSHFNKIQLIKLLEKMVHYHPFFPARGNAFILIAAMDYADHNVISNAMNTLFDENLVKEYSMIAVPLIHLSPNEFIDNLLESLENESAVKAYEILKIFTQFALNEKIDANSKSKIINYLVREIGEFKSKKSVSYYYTDIKIPFTTTLENELYKSWIKIQGLSGKTQYSIDILHNISKFLLPLILTIFTIVVTFDQRNENRIQREEDRRLAEEQRKHDKQIAVDKRTSDDLNADIHKNMTRDQRMYELNIEQ
ncbi:hypothetical protein I4U23_004264 [Adineta vaga]|nr:hypothetical protein I4U23_004264 [Adineta vaga]